MRTGLLLVALSASVYGNPATFEEYAGICWFRSMGTNLAAAESVALSVSGPACDNRGAGTASASASSVLPVTAETWMHLVGGTNPSGVGGTVYVQNRFDFRFEPRNPGAREWVEFRFAAFGFAEVNASSPGSAFARLTTPWGQFEADNEDPALGWQNGRFEFRVDGLYHAWSDTPQSLTMYLRAHGQGSGTGYEYWSHTYLDPVVTLSGEWADRYDVVWSPGISQAVPEASSLHLLAAGLVGLGILRRRTRRASRM